MTNDKHDHDPERLERSLRVWLTEGRPSLLDREAQIHSVLDSLDAPQTRARFLGRWFDRGSGARRRTDAHDHPSNTNRRNQLMLSATGITAAVAILALSVNVIDTEPITPGATADTWVVAADGSGEFETIADAVAAADDGDTVLVRPGAYSEAFTIYHDITLAGDGPVEDIVLTAPVDPPTVSISDFGFGLSNESYAIRLQDADAVLSGMTLQGDDTSIIVEGGAPLLRELVFDGAGVPFTSESGHNGQYQVVIHLGSSATFVDNVLTGGAGIAIADLSDVVIADNLLNSAGLIGNVGDHAEIRGNTFNGGEIYLSNPAGVTIDGNTIHGYGDSSGIQVGTAVGHDPSIRNNVVDDVRYGIQVSGGMPGGGSVSGSGSPTISGNTVSAELVGISVGAADAVVSGNDIQDALNGISLTGGGSAEVTDNAVDVTGYGIDVGANSSPTVEGNTVCGGSVSIKVHDTATPTIGENTIC